MYVTNNSTETIWSQEQSVVISKLRDCMKLNEEYQRCFQQVKAKLALTSNERPFDFSEMYIFGKFDSFIRRCEHIIENFMTMNVYSSLAESNIEGIGIYYTKFQSIVSILKKKEHDVLDQRKQDIENDFEDFHRSIDDLHRNLNEFFEKYFQTMKNTERALNTLKRFEKLQIPNLGLNEKYAQILQQYSKDLDLVAKIYQKHSSEPPLTRDLPPIAGKQSFFFFFLNTHLFFIQVELLGQDNCTNVFKNLWLSLLQIKLFFNILKRNKSLKITINYQKSYFPMKSYIIVVGFVRLTLFVRVFIRVY